MSQSYKLMLQKYKNPVILQNSLTECQTPSSFSLLPKDFSFGSVKKAKDQTSVSLGKVIIQQPENELNIKGLLLGIQMNKKSVVKGSNTKEHLKYKKENSDLFKVFSNQTQKGLNGYLTPKAGPQCNNSKSLPFNFTYGSRSRPATPISLIIQNAYAFLSEQEKEQKYKTMLQKKETQEKRKLKFKSTKSTKLAALTQQKIKPVQVLSEEFKIKKFSKTKPKVQCNTHKKNPSLPELNFQVQAKQQINLLY